MILSDNYLEKMWTNFERQQAIERLMQKKAMIILKRIIDVQKNKALFRPCFHLYQSLLLPGTTL